MSILWNKIDIISTQMSINFNVDSKIKAAHVEIFDMSRFDNENFIFYRGISLKAFRL